MEDVLADYSIVPQRGWAICPFHADRHPSLKVYKDSFYCYACGSGGDVVTFVRRMEDVSNAQAAALIMARHGLGYGPWTAQRGAGSRSSGRDSGSWMRRHWRRGTCCATPADATAGA